MTQSLMEDKRVSPDLEISSASIVFGALVVAWLDPRTVSRIQEEETKGVELMIAIDVSKSMRCEDLGISRLDFAKQSIKRLVSQTHGDRLGLVVFAGDAFIECPLTSDLNAIEMFLGQISPEMIQSQGTAVGRAIDKCITGFDENSNASKVILVLTDGENYEDDLVAAARNAKNTGATVHFIGCGTTNGGPIPDLDSKGRQIGYLQDVNGQIVVSKLDHQILSESAQTGGGIYMRTGNSQDDLKPFLNFKGNLEKSSMATIKFVDFTPLCLGSWSLWVCFC